MNPRILLVSLLSFVAGAALFSTLSSRSVAAHVQPPVLGSVVLVGLVRVNGGKIREIRGGKPNAV